MCEIVNFRVKNFMIATKFHEAWRGLIVAVVQLVFAFSLGVYFLYVSRLVDFVADSDVESLVLSSSSATHLLAASRAGYRGWHSQRERPGSTR